MGFMPTGVAILVYKKAPSLFLFLFYVKVCSAKYPPLYLNAELSKLQLHV